MALIMRVDVDKPYGRDSLPRKVISKIREDYYFPAFKAWGYLRQAKQFASLLREQNITGVFYFRNCTSPDPEAVDFFRRLDQRIGFHAEDTRDIESFKAELRVFLRDTQLQSVHSFTKHGSGDLKLGRHHYPPYEELKYIEWSRALKIPFMYGNGVLTSADGSATGGIAAAGFKQLSAIHSIPEGQVYSKMFWLEEEYRDIRSMPIAWAVEKSDQMDIPVLMHPENYFAIPQVRRDLDSLFAQARANNVKWLAP